MPYLSKKKLYKFEKRVFMNALSLSGALDHTNIDSSSEWLWKYYKGEITEEQFDAGYTDEDSQYLFKIGKLQKG